MVATWSAIKGRAGMKGNGHGPMGADVLGLRWTTAVKLGNEAYTGSPERVRIFPVQASTISTLVFYQGAEPGGKELAALAKDAGIDGARAKTFVSDVLAAIRRWPEFAKKADVSDVSLSAAFKAPCSNRGAGVDA